MCDLKSLTKNCGENVPPGTRAEIFLIPAHELVSQPQTRAEGGGTAAGDTMILDEPFEFITDTGLGYFRKYNIIVDSAEAKDTLVGEVGGRSWENMVSFSIAGTDAEQLEFASCVANACLVAVIVDRTDKGRVFGQYNDPCHIDSIEITTGLKAGDKHGGAYVIKNSSGRPAFIYDVATHGLNETPNV